MATLSASNMDSLKLLASLDDAKIKEITDITVETLLDSAYDNKLSGKEADAQIGLATLFSIFARQASFANSMKPILKDAGISDSSINYISQKYTTSVDLIRGQPSKISVGYPKIVGCDWRLDYTVSNSEKGSVLKPIFFVKLFVEGGKSIDFTCTEEEMTSLVTSLKEASVEASRTSL